jgi:AraC-like DNA-binding protein
LLSAADVVIKEVAYTVGYSHPSSFVRAFRRRFGKSPTEYRQRPRKMLSEIGFC